MENVYGQKKERLVITFELPANEGYENEILSIGSDRNYTDIFGKKESSLHQIARRIFIDLLNQKKQNEQYARSQEISIPS